jgi:hypothetical protein
VKGKFVELHKGADSKVARDRKRRSFDQTRDKLSNLLDQLFFKQKAIEDFVTVADDRAQLLRSALDELKRQSSSKAKNAGELIKETRKKIQNFELDERMTTAEFEAQYKELKTWLRKACGPRPRWSKPTCASSSASRRSTPTAASPSST